MKFTKAMLAFAACGILFTACKKDEETTPHHHNEVTIEITKPTTNAYVFCNDTNPLEVHIHATEQIHGYEVKLINTTDNSVVWEKHDHIHGTHVEITDNIVSTICAETPAKLEVTAIVDHDGNTKVASIDVLLGEAL